MANNKNYNHNQHDRTDNNGQRQNKVHGGEYRNGRLSQIKTITRKVKMFRMSL